MKISIAISTFEAGGMGANMINFREEDFRGYKTNRLVALKKYLA